MDTVEGMIMLLNYEPIGDALADAELYANNERKDDHVYEEFYGLRWARVLRLHESVSAWHTYHSSSNIRSCQDRGHTKCTLATSSTHGHPRSPPRLTESFMFSLNIALYIAPYSTQYIHLGFKPSGPKLCFLSSRASTKVSGFCGQKFPFM